MELEDLGKKIAELREEEDASFVGYPGKLTDKAVFFTRGFDVEDEFIELGSQFEQDAPAFVEGMVLPHGNDAIYVVVKEMSDRDFASLKSIPATKVVGCISVNGLSFEENMESAIELDTPTR